MMHPIALFRLLAMLLVNLLPLIGVMFFGWRVFDVLALFWAENLIIGLFNLLAMAVLTARGQWLGLFLAPFFTVHYGLFCFVHGYFLYGLFGPTGSVPTGLQEALVQVTSANWLITGWLALILSHLISFLLRFVLSGTYRHMDIAALMIAPYARIVILHITILIGALLLKAVGNPVVAVALLVALKTSVEMVMLGRELRKNAVAAAVPQAG
jgi:hypothetical protein